MSDANPSSQRTALLQACRVIETLEAKLRAAEQQQTEPIAIIGMGCRFPGAPDPGQFWQMLCEGVDATRDHPADRWDMEAYYDPTPGLPGKIYARRGAYVEDVDEFDAGFFGIAPREAENMDPQQRLVLETSWAALEDANVPPDQLRNSRTGVYVGTSNTDYALLAADQIGFDQYAGLGVDASALAGRLSYLLGLQGPSMTIATVCSSSLVAVHLACQALKAKECDLALAGGVHLNLAPQSTMYVSLVQAVAPDGRCKTFDAAADGYGRGEGCGMVVLKRLSNAVADSDLIYAVIRGSAVNHDGPSGGLTVPSGPAQESVLRQALAAAHIEPTAIQYVETHGTGTPLGDPIEVRALDRVLGQGRALDSPLLIGSVKTNLGHLEAASGVAGLMKVALALHHGKIPPHLHFQQPNPHIDWANLPVIVPTICTPWPTGPRLAGVSSFGMTGTNAHVVIGEQPSVSNQQSASGAPPAALSTPRLPDRPWHFLTLSAKTPVALAELAQRYAAYLTAHPTLALADVCFTANTGRTHHEHRLAVATQSAAEMAEKLAAFSTGATNGVAHGQLAHWNQPPRAFLFTGQGAQYVNMGRQLYETQLIFRQALEHCDEIVRPLLGQSLLAVMFSEGKAPRRRGGKASGQDDVSLSETFYTQPALFALEYALAQMWLSWGIQPDVVMGHSVGEYVAACLAGVFSLEDGLKLIAARGQLMQALPQDGAMVVVAADEQQVAAAIALYAQDVAIAAVNGPQNVVISGRAQAVAAIVATFQSAGVKTTRLTVSHAFHSPCMEPMLADFAAVARTISYAAPRRKMISNLTGKLAGAEIATPDYWVAHVRQPVQFAAGMYTLQQQGVAFFVEIGPKPTLLGMGRQCLECRMAQVTDPARHTPHAAFWLPSLRQGRDDWPVLLNSLAALYVQGANIDWTGFERASGTPQTRRKMRLPTYPFQRQRYWLRAMNGQLRQGQAQPQVAFTPRRPLIDRMVRSPLLAETLFETVLSVQTHPFLADHQIYGQVVVPAAGYLSLVLSAVELAFGSAACHLEHVVFPEALIIPAPALKQPEMDKAARTVQLVFRPEASASNGHGEQQVWSFKLISLPTESDMTDERQIAVHATGRISLPSTLPPPTQGSVQAWQTACPHPISGAEVYAQVEHSESRWGPTFRWLETGWWSQEGQTLGWLRRPDRLLDVTGYLLHPGLLDSCFQLVGIQQPHPAARQRTFVPFAVSRFTLYRTPGDRPLWCHAEPAGAQRWNLTLVEETGAVVAELTGYEIVEARAAAFAVAPIWQDWLYEIAWQPVATRRVPTNGADSSTAGRWLIFADAEGVGAQLAEQLVAQGQACITIQAGQRYHTHTNNGAGKVTGVTLNPAEPDDFKRLLREAMLNGAVPWRGAIYLWGARHELAVNTDDDAVPEHTQRHCEALLSLVRALNEVRLSPRLWLVTRGTQPVAGPGPLAMSTASLWGLGRTLALEHPELNCRCIDLASDQAATVHQAGLLLAELDQPVMETQVAFRQGRRYVARLVRYTAPPARSLTLDREGCYLITGGLGGLGLKVAGWLAEQGAHRLMLVGRSRPSTSAQAFIKQLTQHDVSVQVLQADVSNAAEVARVLAACVKPLRGVMHAAGVIHDGVLVQQTPARVAEVMAPKVLGAWHLHALTQGLPLQFFVCFSSGASLLGGRGQGNYAAANAFLDALAHHRQGRGLPALSINWGSWAEVGMAARLSEQNRTRLHTQGETLLPPEAGLQVLAALLGQDRAQVGVMAIDWKSFLAQFAPGEPPAFLENFGQRQSPSAPATRPVRQRDTVEALPPAARRDHLVAYLRVQAARSLGRPTADLDIATPLNVLGLDSLMAIDIRTQVKLTLAIDLPIVKLLEGVSVLDLATLIDQELSSKTLKADTPFPTGAAVDLLDSPGAAFVEGEL